MLLPVLILLTDLDAIMSRARSMTAPESGCARAEGAEIAVCGRRAADRFRVPFVGYDPGDPRAETVAGERQRLMAKRSNCQEQRAILVDCGFFGLSVSTGGRSGTRLSGRALAP